VSWSWDARNWKTSTKLLLLLANVWPIIYLALFIGGMITLVVFAERNRNPCGEIDILRLDRKIRDGEIKKLSISPGSLTAIDIRECKYNIFIREGSSREEILRNAREIVNGKPRVDEIVEETSEEADLPPPLRAIAPMAFVIIFVLHMFTIVLMTAQMPFYIVLAVKNAQLQDTIRIGWIVFIALLSIFAAPVYWYLYIWRKQKTDPRETGATSITNNRPTSV